MQTQVSPSISIRLANENDFARIWEIFHVVVRSGDTYSYDPASTPEQARTIWMAANHHVYVGESEGRIEGTYFLKANQLGLGDHIANAGFMVDPAAKAKGIGTQLGMHALAEAKRLGYSAMQFNFVVSTNARAVALWKRIGFSIVGTIPKAFRHSQLGLVDVHIMHQSLT